MLLSALRRPLAPGPAARLALAGRARVSLRTTATTAASLAARAAVAAPTTRALVAVRSSSGSRRFLSTPGPSPAAVVEPPPPATWVESTPEALRPFLYLARVDKPIGSWLLYWPCAWSIILASTVHELPVGVPVFYSVLFGLGAFIMRGAGCTINDLWDQKIDAAVARTRTRPLAAGDLTQKQAVGFLAVQLSAGLGVLTQLNMYSIYLGAASLLPVAIYPFMKRVTHWPQAVLAITFNWGALLGWSAVTGYVDWAIALPLYAGGALWTIMYDTIYAHQDKLDDVKVAVKSTAILFGSATLPIISGFSAGFVGLLAYSGWLAGCSAPFYAVSVGGAVAHLTWQIRTVDLDSRASCWRAFRSNHWLGALIALGFAGDYAWRVGGGRELMGYEKEANKEAKN